MCHGKPDRKTAERGTSRWAAVHVLVALLLILAIAALQLRTSLTDAASLSLLAGTGVLALVLAGLLFRSFLRR